MNCFRCGRRYRSKKEIGTFYQVKMANGKGRVDGGYWLCPECCKALKEWLYAEGEDEPSTGEAE